MNLYAFKIILWYKAKCRLFEQTLLNYVLNCAITNNNATNNNATNNN